MTVVTDSGLFRGICVDNQDPEGLGRIRVQVPQVLGTAASGWAFPAWSFHDLTIWPQDRLPKPGDGVWVMFESTSPDKMIWLAAFGPLDLINQPGFAPEYDYTTTLTMVTPALTWNEPATFTGTLDSNGGGIPNPNPKVYLYALPSGGEWQPVASTDVNPVDGTWALSYTVTLPGVVDYKAVFLGVGVFGPSESTSDPTDTATSTSVSTPVFPTLYHGVGFTVSGTISASNGLRVTTGTAELWYRYTVGADQTWKQSTGAGTVAVVDGTYTLTHGGWPTVSPIEFQVRYFGGSDFLDSVSATVATTINLPAGPPLTKGSVTHTSAAFSWSAVSGAEAYDIERKVGSGSWSTLVSNTTTRSRTDSGLSNSTDYYYRVRPRALDPASTVVYGDWGPYVRANTGRAEQRDSGTSDWIQANTRKTDSYRNDTGWRGDGDIRQGFFSTSYGGYGYFGVMSYGTNALRDKVRSALGGGTTGFNRQTKGICSAAEVYLTKESDTGNYSHVNITFRTTTSYAGSGGRPSLRGSSYTTRSGGPGTSQWYPCDKANGQRIGDGAEHSMAIYRNDSANYASFRNGAIRVKWSWNYVTVSYVAPRWV